MYSFNGICAAVKARLCSEELGIIVCIVSMSVNINKLSLND